MGRAAVDWLRVRKSFQKRLDINLMKSVGYI